MKEKEKPQCGEIRQLMDGRTVTILEKFGKAFKVLNSAGRIEVVYPRQILEPQNQ